MFPTTSTLGMFFLIFSRFLLLIYGVRCTSISSTLQPFFTNSCAVLNSLLWFLSHIMVFYSNSLHPFQDIQTKVIHVGLRNQIWLVVSSNDIHHSTNLQILVYGRFYLYPHHLCCTIYPIR